MKRFFGMAMLAVLAGPAALAQNSDLGLVLGLTVSNNEVTGSSISTQVGASGQINYAYQVWGSPAGELFVEFPVVLSAGTRTEVNIRAVSTSQGATVLFTPGVRYKLPLHARLSLYGALGGGVGAFAGNEVFVSFDDVGNQGRRVSPVLDFGGGADLRLTRLLSLRGEARDFISLSHLGSHGRHHVIGQFGIAFHF